MVNKPTPIVFNVFSIDVNTFGEGSFNQDIYVEPVFGELPISLDRTRSGQAYGKE